MNIPVLPAPMVGLSHVAFRQALRHLLPANLHTLMPTEMLSSRRLPHQILANQLMTLKAPNERGLYPQILGNEEQAIKASVKKLADWGAQAIDINMGCPVKKAIKHNYGVALMGDPEYAKDVVAMTRRHSHLPISVKLRASENNDLDFLIRFCRGLEAAGANWLTLHPREGKQKRKGRADWEQIRELKNALTIPIIGNGDIQTAQDALAMLEETGCDAVMIGRALTARPWLLHQVAQQLGLCHGENLPQTPEEEAQAYGRFLIALSNELFTYFDQKEAFKRLFFMIRVGSPWLNWGHRLRIHIQKAKAQEEVLAILRQFFQGADLRLSPRTQMRY